jgi:hypothetical protein
LQREVAQHPQALAELRIAAENREANLTERLEILQRQLGQMVQQLADKDREHAALLRHVVDDAQRTRATMGRRRPARV